MDLRPFVVIAAMLVLSGIALSAIEDKVPIHWGMSGEPDSYAKPAIAFFLIPLFAIVILGIFGFAFRLDPLRANIPDWDLLQLLIVLFMGYFHLLIVLSAFASFPFPLALLPGFVALFWWLGGWMPRLGPNHIAGIRLSRLIEDEVLWKKTHALAGKLFRAAAIVSLAGFVAGPSLIVVLVGPVLLAAMISLVYGATCSSPK